MLYEKMIKLGYEVTRETLTTLKFEKKETNEIVWINLLFPPKDGGLRYLKNEEKVIMVDCITSLAMMEAWRHKVDPTEINAPQPQPVQVDRWTKQPINKENEMIH